jgi:hypothetical protein
MPTACRAVTDPAAAVTDIFAAEEESPWRPPAESVLQ